jgi:glycyl-tRNA synthetase beta chain
MGQGDAVPTAPVSLAVALADKIDTLTGFWAIDEKPTGSKDPYALRRAALGVVRMVLENGLHRAHLQRLFAASFVSVLADGLRSERLEHLAGEKDGSEHWLVGDRVWFGDEEFAVLSSAEIMAFAENGHLREVDDKKRRIPKLFDLSADLLAFFHDRLKVHLKDEGIRHDIIDAALAKPPADDLFLVVARARALAGFLATPDGENLVQGFRRAANILHQAESADGVEYRYGADVKFAETSEEKALFAALSTAEAAIQPALAAEDFAAAMTHMANLRAPIDAFFEAVQVNAENQIIRRNRLNLLHRIVQTCGAVADLSKLEG